MSTENIEDTESTGGLGLSDRGIAVQACGFGIVGCVSVAILHIFSGSDHTLYRLFDTATTELYWAFLAPLAALFDWGRIMFAKGKAIREAKKAEILAKAAHEGMERGVQQGIQQGIQQERKRSNANLRALAEKYGIPENELPFMDEDA